MYPFTRVCVCVLSTVTCKGSVTSGTEWWKNAVYAVVTTSGGIMRARQIDGLWL